MIVSSDPVTLSGPGEFNLDILKEIEITDSFYELDSEVTKCQSYKSKGTYDNCTTGFFQEQMRLNCGCLPYAISNSTINTEKVCDTYKQSFDHLDEVLLFCQVQVQVW